MQQTAYLADEAATLAFGASCSDLFAAPAVVYLHGGLGAGKTTFVRGLLRAAGHEGAVKSPTYALVESYSLPERTVHHFDLYRFTCPDEWEDAGLDELFGQALCLIEWPQQGGSHVPPPDWIVEISPEGTGRRVLLRRMKEAAV